MLYILLQQKIEANKQKSCRTLLSVLFYLLLVLCMDE